MGIFASEAPKYWAAGLPVIPLWEKKKNPAIKEWSQYGQRMPSEIEQNQWVHLYPKGNIGLPLGPCSGLVAFDVDTTDGKILQVIEEMMPVKSPWRRVGAKGYVVIFRYQGERTFRIKDVGGTTICELLSMGTQIVIPPSIHPDTGLPYTANSELLEVIGRIPRLPPDFERNLRAALTEKSVRLSVNGYSRMTEYVPKSSRDTRYTAVCGMYTRDVLRGSITLVDAIKGVEAWPLTFAENVEGDNVDPKDGIKKLIRFLIKNVRDDGMVLPRGWDRGLSDEDKEALGIDFNPDEQERSYADIAHILATDLDGLESPEEKMEVVAQCLNRINRNRNLKPSEIEVLLRSCSSMSGLRLPISALRRDLQQLRTTGIEGTNHAEIAHHMIDSIEDLRFNRGQFWCWEGSYWCVKPEHEVLSYVVENYGNLPACRKQNDYVAVMKTFRTLVTKDLADVTQHGVNFGNGFLTADGVLHDHSPSFGMTYRLPYCYREDIAGRCPKFFSFLHDCWGHDDDYDAKVQALQEAICATMFGLGTKMSRAILLFGAAHSGKSVLLRIVEGLFPTELVSAVSPDNWGDKFAPAQLVGKLLNIGGELHESRKIEGQQFKQIVVGESMQAQFKNQQLFKFSPMCAHWFASNHLPISNDTSEGFYRRWLVLTFNRQYPEDKRNINLAEEIVSEEREAIVAWAIQSMQRILIQNAYTLPESHEETIRTMMSSNGDSIYSFLQGSQRVQVIPLTPETGKTGDWTSRAISVRALYDEYRTFTNQQAARPVSQAIFKMRMKQHSFKMGFQEVIIPTGNGFQEAGYLGLILATARKGERAI